MRIRPDGLGLRFVSVVQVLVFIAVCVPFNVWSERWCVDTVFMGKDFACPSVGLVLVCSLPDVGIRIRLMGMVSLVSPWSWCSCVAMLCGGESFSPDDAYDSALDSVMPMKGKYTIKYIQYQVVVECGCMLKDWISSCCVFAPTTTTTSSPI